MIRGQNHVSDPRSPDPLLEKLAAQCTLLTCDEVTDLASDDGREALDEMRRAGRVIAVTTGAGHVYPAFQFDQDGRAFPLVQQYIASARERGGTSAALALWLTSHNELLTPPGRPVEMLSDHTQRQLLGLAIALTFPTGTAVPELNRIEPPNRPERPDVHTINSVLAEVARIHGMLTAEQTRLLITGATQTPLPAEPVDEDPRLLRVTWGDRDAYPGFQFTPDGQPSPAIPRLLTAFTEHDASALDLVLWLTAPTTRLPHADVPADLLPDPDAHEALIHAAELSAAVDW